MKELCFPSHQLREAMLEALPISTSQYGDAPEARYIYTPFSHARALDPNTVVVQGIRGAGKSLWWSALLSPDHRKILSLSLPKAGIQPTLTVTNGFSANPDIDISAPKDLLRELIKQFTPRDIWKAILARQVFNDQSQFIDRNWQDRVLWVRDHAEEYEHKLASVDRKLDDQNQSHLVVFDALENVAEGWDGLRRMVKALLELGSEWRSRKSIRIKVFLRPDMLDRETTAFPDASKLLSSKAELLWTRTDLYGLLWQYLSNSPQQGDVFREACLKEYRQRWNHVERIYRVSDQMRSDEDLQREIFHSIAGPWMGTDRKRGFPYSWLVNHLADALGQASPRSFLTALLKAAETPNPQDWAYALHYKGIHKGVQEASQLRVNEISEDYPWLRSVMEPLAGQVVPCDFSLIEDKWRGAKIIETLEAWHSANAGLPPASLSQGHNGLRKDLEQLGVFQALGDRRVQMPDLYRVAFRIGRKGGVKPLK